MQSETKKRLRAMSNIEREKRLDELNRKFEVAQPIKSMESHLEEVGGTGVAEKEVGLHATLNRIVRAAMLPSTHLRVPSGVFPCIGRCFVTVRSSVVSVLPASVATL